MSGEIEAAGDLVAGAAVARAVEPGAGEAGAAASFCLNCGARLNGPHCHACGQKAEVHRTLHAFWHDFTHSILHFEGKIWRTLPLLVARPGELTRRYVHGERARFVSPLALFLFSVFLMFAVFSAAGGPFAAESDMSAIRRGVAEEGRTLANRLASLERQRKDLVAVGRPTGFVDEQMAEVRTDQRTLQSARSIVLVPNAAPEGTSQTIDLRDAQVDTGWQWLDESFLKARNNPSLLLYKVQSNAYKFSWALVLLSLPFVWLVFARRRQLHVFDHLVFVTYSLCFVTLLLVTSSLLTALGLTASVSLLFLIGVPLHLFAQLRGAYALSFPAALWRTIFLLAAAGVVMLAFTLLLLALGLL